MAWIRTGVFVSLTLVATTLPVRGHTAPVVQPAGGGDLPEPTDAATDPKSTGGQTARGTVPSGTIPSDTIPSDTIPSDTSPDGAVPGNTQDADMPGRSGSVPDQGLLLQAPIQMDVWKSAPTRPMGSSGPQLLAVVIQASARVWKPSAGLAQDLQSHATRVHEHAREWLNCRYPNAPPVSA